ncbi:MAG: squalene synthase HpnC [Ignavibacteriae bacterium]|nr:squalene synthase HpnC [Ignavibacteriota bacterium]
MSDQIIKSELTLLYNQAIDFTNSHYENFPVLSFFVPKKLRKYVAVVYQFARQADDISDEGNHSNQKKLIELEKYENELIQSFNQNYKNDFWKVFYHTIISKNLTKENFINLIKAFKQDLIKFRYNDFDDLLNYCKNSADPVGRIILEIYEIRNKEAKKYSDLICTALQLTNFYQDVSIDFKKGRIYIPQNEMKKFSVGENDFQNTSSNNIQFVELMKFQIERTKKMFLEGRKLLDFLPFRLRMQILVTIKSGEAILYKLENINYDVLNQRPKLSKIDFIKIFSSAIIFGK